MADSSTQTVLLIEAEASLRRLITLGLQQQGIAVIATDPQHWPSLPPDYQPALLVIDIDTGRRQDASLLQILRAQPQFAGATAIALSWDWETPCLPRDETTFYVRKPFDARFLYALIEKRLAAQPVVAEAVIHQTSFCPLATAAGLLLVIVGLMGQLVLAGTGLAIALAALLWWTLGQQPRSYLSAPWLQPSHPCHV
jgi:CheY-like chemotaxis protein